LGKYINLLLWGEKSIYEASQTRKTWDGASPLLVFMIHAVLVLSPWVVGLHRGGHTAASKAKPHIIQ
jgi:hypothetical protein